MMCLGKNKMILSLRWLQKHNPEVNWATNKVKMSCCPAWCHTCVREVTEERKVCKAESAKICTCQTRPLPASVEDMTDDESIDLPDLTPNPDSEEDGDDESLEEGDHTFMASIPAEAKFIQATQTTSQWLAKAFHKNTIPKSFCDSVPTHIHDFKDVFSKVSFDALPM
jgi:hypothetical protein